MTRASVTAIAMLLLAPLASGVSAQTPDPGMPPAEVQRIAGLGKVWGFLKYYHPGVAGGSIDWDSALVAMVPVVRASSDRDGYNGAITALLDAAGPVPACASCQQDDPARLLHNMDLGWTRDTALFTPAVIERLDRIRRNPHHGDGRYVTFHPQGTAAFAADTGYAEPSYPAEPVRLLALFRYWNFIQYHFPYLYVNDGDWKDVLREFVPRMIAASDARAYHVAVLELTTRLNDSHVSTLSPVLTTVVGPRVPAFTARSIEGHIVVTRVAGEAPADGGGVRPGDVITHIDGEPVAERRRALARYIAAGNPAAFERYLVDRVLRGHADSAVYTVTRDGASLQRAMPLLYRPPVEPGWPSPPPVYPVSQIVYVLPGGIGYVNMGDLEPAQVDSAVAILRGTSGIIMDVRNYPRGSVFAFSAFLLPEPRPFARFTVPDPTMPGAYLWAEAMAFAGPREPNPDAYTGRIAILVDERSRSHAEFTAMALQTAPDNRVIGSQTAGADGNIVIVSLPGRIRTVFTGLGIYYPDGTQTQRIGIVPDIEVRPTLAGVLAGRDEVLERAIDYIRNGG